MRGACIAWIVDLHASHERRHEHLMINAPPRTSLDSHPPAAAGVDRPFTAAFVLVTSLFFMWAIAHNLNDILIKQFQKALQLSRGEASFIQVAFYLAYFVFSLPAGYAMKRIGLKRTMILGLTLYGLGALAFYPAAEIGTFPTFLAALFVIASGIVCLEIAAGAFIVLAGTRERSAFRINLAQAFNGLGAVIAPAIGGWFIFSGRSESTDPSRMTPTSDLMASRSFELHQVQLPYLIIGLVALTVATLIGITRFPEQGRAAVSQPVSYSKLFRERTFAGAVVAQFFYVGAQVAVWSFFIDFVRDTRPDIAERQAAYLLSGSLFLFMVGRFTGSVLLRFAGAPTVLICYGGLAVCMVLGAVLSTGTLSVACLMAISFFMSIMYPTIFGLGVVAAREQGQIGAAVMVMTIVGGAGIPPALGFLADHVGVRSAYLVLLGCFTVVILFGAIAGRRVD
jgi:FHS family L-fucose permease-like MFS transporter